MKKTKAVNLTVSSVLHSLYTSDISLIASGFIIIATHDERRMALPDFRVLKNNNAPN